MQYNLYTVSVTNGSNIVNGALGTKFLSKVKAGNSFKVKGDAVVYQISSVVSDTQLTLSTPYQGATAANLQYQVTTDYTPNFGFAEINIGDQDWPTHLTVETIRKIDAVLAMVTDGIKLKGNWNATTNVPALPTPSVDNIGWLYKVSVAGTYTFSGVVTQCSVGDSVMSNGSVWFHIAIPEASAATSATAAATSATAAATSATSASSSAAAALTSKNTAATSATTATTKASEAATSATNASTSATTATTKASEAATSATNASTSATNASTSATTATTKASEAATSATVANTAKLAAEAARDQALTAFDNFDDRYLGQKSSNPTVDNDGNALIAGTLYFNTSGDGMKVYDGAVWVAAYSSIDPTLTALAAVTTAADKLIYASGVDTFTTTTLTSTARALLADTSTSAMLTTLGAAPSAKGVTNGDSHDHSGGDGAQIAYSSLGSIPSTFTPASHTTASHSDWPAAVTMTEVGYLDGVTSAIQTQLNNKQPLDATLTALAGVTTAADKLIYATGSDTFTTATLTSTARTLLDDTTTGAMLTTLGAAADNAVVKLTGDQTVAGIKTLTSKTNLSGGALLPNTEALDLTANNRPSIRPSLLLDFANSKILDPRITYTRASTATYYDGKTFAKAEENLLTYSQDFSNAAWTKSNVTVVAGSATAPDGTATADLVYPTGNLNSIAAASAPVSPANELRAMSFFVKANGWRWVMVRSFGSTDNGVWFDLTNGVVGTNVASYTVTITGIVNGWYRLTLIGATTASGTHTSIRLVDGDQSTVSTPNGTNGVYLWGFQVEARSSVTAYTPTTTQPITNYIPQLMTAASGVPRFDHNPTTGESLGLLIEESRANLLTYSEDFSNAAWTKSNATVSSNVIVAPDGTLTGDKLVEDTANTIHRVYSITTSLAASTAHTYSVYAKAGERPRILVQVNSGANFTASPNTVFDLSNGTIVSSGNGLSTITHIGNGWYRCTITATTIASSVVEKLWLSLDNGTAPTYTGDGYSGIYIWGAQLEAGAFPTSYIKTEASAATRAADAASMTGTNFSSWYRQDQGTFIAAGRFRKVAVNDRSALLSFGATSLVNDCQLLAGYGTLSSASNIRILGYNNSSLVLNLEGGAFNTGDSVNLALAYAPNDNSVVTNGGTVSNSTGTLSYLSNKLVIGAGLGVSYNKNNCIKKIAYYPARLSNATLQAMTTP